MKSASCKSALNPPVVYSTDRSKAVVPVLVLLFVILWFILRGGLLYVLLCVVLFLSFFGPFSIVITSLGEERANLGAFRTFVRFVLDWFCRFSLPLGVWEGLRFVVVALWTFILPVFFFFFFFSFNDSNTDGSLTVAALNMFLCPQEIIPIAQENIYFWIFLDICLIL